MPAYRFSWDAFDDATVFALARALGFEGTAIPPARAYLAQRCKRPSPEFAGEFKELLAETWLVQYTGASHIVARLIDQGIGPLGRPRSQRGYAEYVSSCRNSKTLRRVLCEAMLRFGDQDRPSEDKEEDGGFVPRFAVLTPSSQKADPRKPHDYQREAWERLNAHLAESASTGIFQGLVVMPTGSGKTFTAVRWLLQNVVSSGQRVLWLAHRHELLTQAAMEVHRAAGVCSREKVRVRIVSGEHCAATQIDPADDFILASVQSLARRADLRDDILADPKLFVVVDEAHHAPAKSYRDMITKLSVTRRFRVLGLTATPTRTVDDERPVLARLFGKRILFQLELRPLIERGILARPRIVRVTTNADVEAGVTSEDLQYLSQFDELSEDWLARIAAISSRNGVIIDHYVQNRTKYGKALIFAINVHHAALLGEQLRQRGVRADYVASYRPDGTEGEPADVIARFRAGELDVLVNVHMVTEGVDVPDIKTVFLTRPTTSEILTRQMIGRALRGPAAGGTKEAYLVSFEDHWERFHDWASPFALVPDIESVSDDDAPRSKAVRNAAEHLPWDLIRAAAQRLLQRGLDAKADAFEAVPHGWYVLERDADDQGLRHIVPVYEHQRACWEAFFDALQGGRAGAADHGFVAKYDEFFGDCDHPRPLQHDVTLAVGHFASGGPRPVFQDLERRAECDPYELARRIYDEDMGERTRVQFIEQRYSELAKAIYPNLREFRAAIEDALYELHHPDEVTRVRRAVPIFDPGPEQQLRPGPTHDLEALLREVLEKGRELLVLIEPLPRDGILDWTGRIVKGWYGKAFYEEGGVPGHGRIRINSLLNSADVSPDTMRFLLWHEYLHVYLRQGHTPTFRQLERRWPGAVGAERELDTLNERFGTQYW